MSGKTDSEKVKEVKQFVYKFRSALVESAKAQREIFPLLAVSDIHDIEYGSETLTVEFTSSLSVIVAYFCSQEADCMDSKSYWPYFDLHDRLRMTDHPDNIGFADPRGFADHCVQCFVQSNQKRKGP